MDMGVASAVASAVAYGVAPVVYGPGVRACGVTRAMPVFAAFAALASPLLGLGPADARGMLLAAVAGVLGGAVGGYAYLRAVSISPALGNSSSSSYVVFASLISGEWSRVPWAALVFAGLAALSRGGGSPRAVAYGVAAALAWGFSINVMALAVGLVGPGTAQAVRSAVLATLFTALSRGSICASRRVVAGAFLDSFVGFTTFMYALSLLGPASTAIIVGAYPAVTALITRELSGLGWLGLGMIAAGVAGSILAP